MSTAEPSNLPQLPFPIYFLCKNRKRWGDLLDGAIPPDLSLVHDRLRDARDAWGVQTYIHLKRRGLNVHLVSQWVPGQIHVVTYEELLISDRPYHSYVVCCRHDRGIPRICQQTIVQNKDNVLSESDYYLPHWVQPLIEPRDASRGDRVETVSYKGLLLNMAKPFREPGFLADIAKEGFTFKVSPDDEVEQERDFRNYKDVDVILAVRNGTEYNLSIKPPSKLINAWTAGCPAILGPESAFQQLRKSPLDFIEVKSPAEVIEGLKKLRSDPGLYRAMVENGRERAREFSADSVASLWRDLLAGPVAEGYERWRNASALERQVLRPVRFGLQAVQHRAERRRFRHLINTGPRLF